MQERFMSLIIARLMSSTIQVPLLQLHHRIWWTAFPQLGWPRLSRRTIVWHQAQDLIAVIKGSPYAGHNNHFPLTPFPRVNIINVCIGKFQLAILHQWRTGWKVPLESGPLPHYHAAHSSSRPDWAPSCKSPRFYEFPVFGDVKSFLRLLASAPFFQKQGHGYHAMPNVYNLLDLLYS